MQVDKTRLDELRLAEQDAKEGCGVHSTQLRCDGERPTLITVDGVDFSPESANIVIPDYGGCQKDEAVSSD